MTRHFATLKFRLLVNGLRGKRGRRALFLLAPLFGLAVVLPVFGMLANVSPDSSDALSVATLAFTAAFAGWIVIFFKAAMSPLKMSVSTPPEIPGTAPLSAFCQKCQSFQPLGMLAAEYWKPPLQPDVLDTVHVSVVPEKPPTS